MTSLGVGDVHPLRSTLPDACARVLWWLLAVGATATFAWFGGYALAQLTSGSLAIVPNTTGREQSRESLVPGMPQSGVVAGAPPFPGDLTVGTSDGRSMTIVPPAAAPHSSIALDQTRERFLITIDNASAPRSYTFRLGLPADTRARSESDGSVSVLDRRGDTVQTISAPWAKDANGNDLSTGFVLDGDELIQHVQFDAGTAFPILADPDTELPDDGDGADEDTSTPAADEDTNTPAADENTNTPPADENTNTPPTDENTNTPPTDENTNTPPTDENTNTPPTDENTNTPPTDENTSAAVPTGSAEPPVATTLVVDHAPADGMAPADEPIPSGSPAAPVEPPAASGVPDVDGDGLDDRDTSGDGRLSATEVDTSGLKYKAEPGTEDWEVLMTKDGISPSRTEEFVRAGRSRQAYLDALNDGRPESEAVAAADEAGDSLTPEAIEQRNAIDAAGTTAFKGDPDKPMDLDDALAAREQARADKILELQQADAARAGEGSAYAGAQSDGGLDTGVAQVVGADGTADVDSCAVLQGDCGASAEVDGVGSASVSVDDAPPVVDATLQVPEGEPLVCTDDQACTLSQNPDSGAQHADYAGDGRVTGQGTEEVDTTAGGSIDRPADGGDPILNGGGTGKLVTEYGVRTDVDAEGPDPTTVDTTVVDGPNGPVVTRDPGLVEGESPLTDTILDPGTGDGPDPFDPLGHPNTESGFLVDRDPSGDQVGVVCGDGATSCSVTTTTENGRTFSGSDSGEGSGIRLEDDPAWGRYELTHLENGWVQGPGGQRSDTTEGGSVSRDGTTAPVVVRGRGVGELTDENGTTAVVGAPDPEPIGSVPGDGDAPTESTLVDVAGDAPSIFDLIGEDSWRVTTTLEDERQDVVSGRGTIGTPLQLRGADGTPLQIEDCRGCDFTGAEGDVVETLPSEVLDVIGRDVDGLGGRLAVDGVESSRIPASGEFDDLGPVITTAEGVDLYCANGCDTLEHRAPTEPGQGGISRCTGTGGTRSCQVLGAPVGPNGERDTQTAYTGDDGGFAVTVEHRAADGTGGGAVAHTTGSGRADGRDAFGDHIGVVGDGAAMGLLYTGADGYHGGQACTTGNGGSCTGSVPEDDRLTFRESPESWLGRQGLEHVLPTGVQGPVSQITPISRDRGILADLGAQSHSEWSGDVGVPQIQDAVDIAGQIEAEGWTPERAEALEAAVQAVDPTTWERLRRNDDVADDLLAIEQGVRLRNGGHTEDIEARLVDDPNLVALVNPAYAPHAGTRAPTEHELEVAADLLRHEQTLPAWYSGQLTALQPERTAIDEEFAAWQNDVEDFRAGRGGDRTALNARLDELQARDRALTARTGPLWEQLDASQERLRSFDSGIAGAGTDAGFAGALALTDGDIDSLAGVLDTLPPPTTDEQRASYAQIADLAGVAGGNYRAATVAPRSASSGLGDMMLPSTGFDDAGLALTSASRLPSYAAYDGDLREHFDKNKDRVADLAAHLTPAEAEKALIGASAPDPAQREQLILGEQGDPAVVEARIAEYGGTDGDVTALPMLYTGANGAETWRTLFRVTAPDGSTRFVDGAGTTYGHLTDFLNNNDLDKTGTLVRPELDALPGAQPFSAAGAAHINDWWDTTRETADPFVAPVMIGGGIAMLVGSGVVTVGTAGAGTPAGAALYAGGSAALWGGIGYTTLSAAEELLQRGGHDRRLDLADPEARAKWVTLGSTLTAGAGGILVRLAGREVASAAPLANSPVGNFLPTAQRNGFLDRAIPTSGAPTSRVVDNVGLDRAGRGMNTTSYVLFAEQLGEQAHTVYDGRDPSTLLPLDDETREATLQGVVNKVSLLAAPAISAVGGRALNAGPLRPEPAGNAGRPLIERIDDVTVAGGGPVAVSRLADRLGVSAAEVRGALATRAAAPVVGLPRYSVEPRGGGLTGRAPTVQRQVELPEATRGRALVDEAKFGYLFGRVTSNEHNAARSTQNADQLARIGVHDTVTGRAVLRAHLDEVVASPGNVASTYTNQHGTFQVRESLLAGPGGFLHLQTTWMLTADGLKFTTMIPRGGS